MIVISKINICMDQNGERSQFSKSPLDSHSTWLTILLSVQQWGIEHVLYRVSQEKCSASVVFHQHEKEFQMNEVSRIRETKKKSDNRVRKGWKRRISSIKRIRTRERENVREDLLVKWWSMFQFLRCVSKRELINDLFDCLSLMRRLTLPFEWWRSFDQSCFLLRV